MAANLSRWFKYAQAKLNDLVASGHRDLDELESRRAAEVADRPWLASDRRAPTFDEAKARIAWESDAPLGAGRSVESTPPAGDTAASQSSGDPDVAAARLELDRQARESQARLAAIRKELGVDPDEGPPTA